MKFRVYGPFELKRKNKRLVTKRAMMVDFVQQAESTEEGLSKACGCYAFGVSRGSGGWIPWYVGKADSQAFKDECFSTDKTEKYREVYDDMCDQHGTPSIFLIAKLKQKGGFSQQTKTKCKFINALEGKLLMLKAFERNQDIINQQGLGVIRQLEIEGLLNNPKPGANPGYDLRKALRWRFG